VARHRATRASFRPFFPDKQRYFYDCVSILADGALDDYSVIFNEVTGLISGLIAAGLW